MTTRFTGFSPENLQAAESGLESCPCSADGYRYGIGFYNATRETMDNQRRFILRGDIDKTKIPLQENLMD